MTKRKLYRFSGATANYFASCVESKLSWPTGETIAIAASRKLGFAPAKQVKDALAG
jgi:nucleoid DNA-binding protein